MGVPPTTPFNMLARLVELMPNCRALSWATSTRKTLPGAFQSKVGTLRWLLLPTISASFSASSRRPCKFGPLSLYCTGRPTGGPIDKG